MDDHPGGRTHLELEDTHMHPSPQILRNRHHDLQAQIAGVFDLKGDLDALLQRAREHRKVGVVVAVSQLGSIRRRA